MVSFSKAVILLSVVAGANAFAPIPFNVESTRTAVFMSEEVAEAPVEGEVAAPVARKSSGMELKTFRKNLKSLSAENFSQTLAEIEAFLVNDAGSSLYSKTMKRISTQANLLGQKIPEGYASDAAATEKRRVKQDAFIKAKEEERIAAEAEAAEAAAEAEPEETSEETKAVEEAVEEPEPVVA